MKKKNLKKIIGIAVSTLLAVYVIGSVSLIDYFVKFYFSKSDRVNFSTLLRWKDYENLERETVTFPSGKETLTGYIYGKENTSLGLVVVSHGLTRDSEEYMNETKYFVDKGFMVFAFDNTGSGKSTGESYRGLAQSVIDLDNALKYVEQNALFDGLPICLYGHSWGGYATTAVLNCDHDIVAVASLAGYNSCMQQMYYSGEKAVGSLAVIEKPFMWLMQYFRFGDKMMLTAADGINHASDTAVMIVQGDLDDFVGYDGPCIYNNREKITNPNVKYVVLEGREHDDLMFDYGEERVNYRKQMNEEYKKLEEQYDGKIPDEVRLEWSNSVDKELLSRLNEELFADIVEFYKQAIEK